MSIVLITLASIGSIGLLLLGFVLTVITWSEIQDKRFERSRKKEYLLIELGLRRLGGDLVRDQHWFSEDLRSMNLIRELGECLSKHGSLHVETVREYWRARNKAEGFTPTGVWESMQ